MRYVFRLLTIAVLASSVFFKSSAADSPAPINPSIGVARNMNIHIALVRFRPNNNTNLVRYINQVVGKEWTAEGIFGEGMSFVINVLRQHGDVDVLHRANRDVMVIPDGKVKFDAVEERPVLVVGKKDLLPPATKFGLTLEMTTKMAEGDRIGLIWNGSLKWSPELIDRWNGDKFLKFATLAAKTGSSIAQTADTQGGNSLKLATDIGLGLAELVSGLNAAPTEGQLFEMPVVKEISFQSSRFVRNGDLIANSTVAEVGGRNAQSIILFILPLIEP